jgi:hypothetical protein
MPLYASRHTPFDVCVLHIVRPAQTKGAVHPQEGPSYSAYVSSGSPSAGGCIAPDQCLRAPQVETDYLRVLHLLFRMMGRDFE